MIYESRSRRVFHGAPLDRFDSIIKSGLVTTAPRVSSVADMAGGRYPMGVYVGDLELAAGYAIGKFHHGYTNPGHLYEIDLADASVMMDTDAFFEIVQKAKGGDRQAAEILGDDQFIAGYLSGAIETDDTGFPLDDGAHRQLLQALHRCGVNVLSGRLSGQIVPTDIGPQAIIACYLLAPADGKTFDSAAAEVKKVVYGRGSLRQGQIINFGGM